MKRRELKKGINILCGELMAETIALRYINKNVTPAEIDNIMLGILKMQNDLISRLSHVEPGSTKAFFVKLHKDTVEYANSISEQIKKLV